MYLFTTSESHQWRFGWPSDEDRKLEEKPLSFLKRTVPWFVAYQLTVAARAVTRLLHVLYVSPP